MAKLTDLLPNPLKAANVWKATFDKREGQPWLQGTARNLGHMSFGDTVGDYVDQRVLGDIPSGTKGAPLQMPEQMQMQSQPNPLMQLIEQMMRQRGGM